MSGNRGDHRRVWEALRLLALDAPKAGAELQLLIGGPDRELAIKSALRQGLGAALDVQLRSQDVAIPDVVRTRVEEARFVRLSSLNVLGRIGELLDPAGVAWVAMKGPVLAYRYANPELRTFSDVDVLVPGSQFGEAISILAGGGFADVNRNWGNYLRYGVAEIPLAAPGLAIDLHWHLIGLESRRAGTNLDVAGMLARRRIVDLGGVQVPTFDVEDLLIHVALHAGMSGATRLVWLRDIRELVRAEPPDWSVVVERLGHTGVGGRVGQVLDRARVVLGAAVPEDVVAAVSRGALLRIRRSLDAIDSGGGLPDRFLRGFPVEVSEATWIATCQAILLEASHRLRPQPSWDAGDRHGPLYWGSESGDAGARDRYLRYAAANS